MAGRDPEALLTVLLGENAPVPGEVELVTVGPGGRTAAAISAGGPACLSRKGQVAVPNEDALFAADFGDVALHAVADGHWGHRASHAAIQRARKLCSTAVGAAEAIQSLAWTGTRNRDEDRSRTTLVLARVDRSQRSVEGWSIGDSAVFLVRGGGRCTRLTEPNRVYAAPHRQPPLRASEVRRFRAELHPGDMVVSCSDGVFECHYGSPSTSIQGEDLVGAAANAGDDPAALAAGIAHLALAGVRGHPGGEDNIAIAVSLV